MTLADNTERLLEQMSLKTRESTDERILNDAFTEFDKSAPAKKAPSGEYVRFVNHTGSCQSPETSPVFKSQSLTPPL